MARAGPARHFLGAADALHADALARGRRCLVALNLAAARRPAGEARLVAPPWHDSVMRSHSTMTRKPTTSRHAPPSGALAAGALAAVALGLRWLEGASPRRVERPGGHARLARNAAVALAGGLVVAAIEAPVAKRLASLVATRRWGLLPRLRLAAWAETAAALVLLDYTLYLWHVANHRVPFLWRFHAVHHVDDELDVTTAVRFHPGELLLSVAVRAAQIVAIGVSPRALSRWQTLTLASVCFHHANVRLPPRLERALGRVVVTPRLHSIHHSTRRDERDANWSSGLTWWDRAHGTLRLDPPDVAAIGVDGLPERSLLGLLALPFEGRRAG